MKALAVASGIVFWTLTIGVALLIFFPGSDSGEPVAVLDVDAAPPGPPSAVGGVDLPPGFSVTGPAVRPVAPPPPAPPALAPPGGTAVVPAVPGQPALPPAPPPPGPSGALQEAPGQPGAVSGAQPPVAGADLVPGVDETGEDLAEAPVAAVTEESPYGPIPAVASDGRRPADVYARASRYAGVQGGPPRVAVLIAGLGVPGAPDADVIKGLPPPVSVAYGAYGRGIQDRVTQARADGHEVLLAIPLEPHNYPAVDPGPHTLLTTLPTNDNIKRLQWLMSRYAGYFGVTNFMGERFAAEAESLRPVLEEVKRRGLVYFGDGSVPGSAAPRIAEELDLDFAAAQVRLDERAMDSSLAELEAAAKSQGAAIGVAKAAPGTVKQIAEWAGSLESKGLVLVPVSAAMRSRRQS